MSFLRCLEIRAVPSRALCGRQQVPQLQEAGLLNRVETALSEESLSPFPSFSGLTPSLSSLSLEDHRHQTVGPWLTRASL